MHVFHVGYFTQSCFHAISIVVLKQKPFCDMRTNAFLGFGGKRNIGDLEERERESIRHSNRNGQKFDTRTHCGCGLGCGVLIQHVQCEL